MLGRALLRTALWAAAVYAQAQEGVDSTSGEAPEPELYTKDLSPCPGYIAKNYGKTKSGFHADLTLAGEACNLYGIDLPDLKLEVEYQTAERLHVKILDTNNTVYQVPDEIFPRPGYGQWCSQEDSQLKFDFVAEPFSFSVSRTDSGEVLFDTSGSKLVFESQYVHLKTKLPEDPHLYGLGEHSDSFMLNSTNYTRTIWTRDAYSLPQGENLYGAHPIYFEHRKDEAGAKTHGVFLLNSNGMDIYIDDKDGQTLEYNIIGGVLDFYFIAGPSPKDVAQQYAEIAELPLMTPYWGLGFHQCKYGYRDVYQVAEVVANYSEADIPLETMWTDIDYMDLRRVFTLDPERFPAHLVTDLVNTIHARDQHYIVMVDPAVWSAGSNDALDRGIDYNTFLKESNGSLYQGVVWPGPTVFPDWFHPNASAYWNEQFTTFFNGVQGPDIDALWIDMNEPANFCNRPYPCNSPTGFAEEEGNPPEPPPVRGGPDAPIPGFPASLQPNFANGDEKHPVAVSKRDQRAKPHGRGRGSGHWHGQSHKPSKGGWQQGKQSGSGCGPGECLGLPNREYILPPYMIQNGAGPTLAEGTADTDLVHSGGLVEYDVHNLYGTMMSTYSKNAMLARRPDVRPLVITRSTFAGAGKDASHWLGDNVSGWLWYRISISQQLQFASLYQIPVVGSDVCGFGGNTTDTLCARWATLGSFSTFFRNHAEISSIDQEFYRWPIVASAARNGIRMRYLLLDYIYTAIYRQNQTGLPCLNPLFFNYPEDPNTYPIDLQFFYGDGILVSPVTEENSTSVRYYLPDDIFYDFATGKPVRGEGAYVTAEVPYDKIPVHYKGGHIFPQRVESANTTTALRTKGFNIVIAPGLDGMAEGFLYLDDGESLVQDAVSEIEFKYESGKLSMTGSFEYDAGVRIESVTLLGVSEAPEREFENVEYDERTLKRVVVLAIPLTGPREVEIL
ncbi:putative alpha/beta-glucosidase agdC [Fulvia fulva]|uniref:Alpha/beta-glucosidase agdC n=1 Tax=Passalora fulva TaxID=5499 RepID=A0A9Q8LDI0_PASFU|nr:putative alpha/beta-glucosidase agdC [Fulvia fulva]UJO15385.1 putative alpha/beta-glucosidase agdC [Fulvia fulva]WPV12649.1 putative alpha/beta-glucosidase agdC [Fulvia fulva]